jgi:hypothetical protein
MNGSALSTRQSVAVAAVQVSVATPYRVQEGVQWFVVQLCCLSPSFGHERP